MPPVTAQCAPWRQIPSVITLACSLIAAPLSAAPAQATVIQAQAYGQAAQGLYEAQVEAVRQSQVAAQVSGAVVDLAVRAGDTVKAGQVLLRIDARAAEQGAAAGVAQAQSARAALDLARSDLDRQRQLHQKGFISDASLDRAQSQFKATQAQTDALLSQAEMARTQTALHVLRAPFDGVVAEVQAVQGDMAMPGRPLLTLYDPRSMRAAVALPQAVAAGLPTPLKADAFNLQWPTGPGQDIRISRVELLPLVDGQSHTMTLRLDLTGAAIPTLRPGQFLRVAIPGTATHSGLMRIPSTALVRRGEVDAVYVMNSQNRPLLRQVRLGRRFGDAVEVLSGLRPEDRILANPQQAAAQPR